MSQRLKLHMSRKNSGNFSSSLLSLELQFRTLFDDVGGEGAIDLLDAISPLSTTERKIAMKLFISVANKISSGPLRLESADEAKMRELENTIYDDLVHSIEAETLKASNAPNTRKLEVLDGGHIQKVSVEKTIDLSAARQRRKKETTNPVVN